MRLLNITTRIGLSNREKLFILALIVVLISSIYYSFFYIPIKNDIKIALAEIDSIKSSIDQMEFYKSAHYNIRKEYKTIDTSKIIKDVEQKDIALFLCETLNKYSEEKSISFKKDQYYNNLKCMLVEIEGSMDYNNLIKLLKHLEEAPYYNIIDSIDVQMLYLKGDNMFVKVKLSVEFLCLHSTAKA
ncbi:MAG: hypothetical protein ACFWUE_11205 [Xylanivirga thermophila]